MPNFKKAAFIVFLYSLFLTASISFLAVMLIPDSERMPKYNSNLISGLVMNLVGPNSVLLVLNGFVVVVGFLLLAGGVNTAVGGFHGVLNRVAGDGGLPGWVFSPHPPARTPHPLLGPILIFHTAAAFTPQR